MKAFRIINNSNNWKKGDLPFDVMVCVAINDCVHTESKDVVISQKLASDSEIDWAFDDLIKQLETARKHAKKQLKIGIDSIK